MPAREITTALGLPQEVAIAESVGARRNLALEEAVIQGRVGRWFIGVRRKDEDGNIMYLLSLK